MIKIDFHAGTHGHFLEYVTNVFIMLTDPGYISPFTPGVGNSHNTDAIYQQNKIVRCGHFSANAGGHYADPKYRGHEFHYTDRVIRINVDQSNDQQFFVALTNLLHRAGESHEHNLLSFPGNIRNDIVLYRENFFAKINERELYCNQFPILEELIIPTFVFPFNYFFSFYDFVKSLTKMAKWLDLPFEANNKLYVLWAEFIERNQGLQSYNKCSTIIENAFNNIDYEFESTVLEQAWINYNMSKHCNVYDGPLYSNITYPTNSQQIYKIIS
jgi:hypothetical protein